MRAWFVFFASAALNLALFPISFPIAAEEDLSSIELWRGDSGLTILSPPLDMGTVVLRPYNPSRSYFSKTRLVHFRNDGSEFLGVEINCSAELGDWHAPKGKAFVDAVGYLGVPKTKLSCIPDAFLLAAGQEIVVKMELEGAYPNVHIGHYDILGKAEILLNGNPHRRLEIKGRVRLVNP